MLNVFHLISYVFVLKKDLPTETKSNLSFEIWNVWHGLGSMNNTKQMQCLGSGRICIEFCIWIWATPSEVKIIVIHPEVPYKRNSNQAWYIRPSFSRSPFYEGSDQDTLFFKEVGCGSAYIQRIGYGSVFNTCGSDTRAWWSNVVKCQTGPVSCANQRQGVYSIYR